MAGARPPGRHPKRTIPSQPGNPARTSRKRLSADSGANIIASIAALIALGALIAGIVAACQADKSAKASQQSEQAAVAQAERSNEFAQQVENRLIKNERRQFAERVTITTSTKDLPEDLIWVTVNNRGQERIRLPILEQDGATRTDPIVRLANIQPCTSRRFLVSRIWWNAKLDRPHLLYKDVNGRWWHREENAEVQDQKGSEVLRARAFEWNTKNINNQGTFSEGDVNNRSVLLPYNEEDLYCPI